MQRFQKQRRMWKIYVMMKGEAHEQFFDRKIDADSGQDGQ